MKEDKKMNSIKSPEFLEGFKVARADVWTFFLNLKMNVGVIVVL